MGSTYECVDRCQAFGAERKTARRKDDETSAVRVKAEPGVGQGESRLVRTGFGEIFAKKKVSRN